MSGGLAGHCGSSARPPSTLGNGTGVCSTATGLHYCDEALGLSPAPFDAALSRIVHGYGLVRCGQAAAGTAELREALTWLERSQLRYTRSVTALRLAEGYLRLGELS